MTTAARLLLLWLLSATSIQELVIIGVNDNGADDSTCLKSNGSKPCKSLQYVLHKLTGQNTSWPRLAGTVLVNVSSNQSISGALNYQLSSCALLTMLLYPSLLILWLSGCGKGLYFMVVLIQYFTPNFTLL